MPKVVTQRCLEQDLNPRPTDRKPECLTRCTTASPIGALTLSWPTGWSCGVPVFVELGGHLFAQSQDDVRHGFLAVVAGRHSQLIVQRLHDALLVGQTLFEVADSLLVDVGVERQLGRQLRLAILGVVTQSTFTVAAGDTADHSLANWDSCPTPAKSEAIEYPQVGPTEIRYSIAWTIFVYL